jgi:hypothetical protein
MATFYAGTTVWKLERPSLLDQFNPVETMYLRAASRYEGTRFIAHAVSYTVS